MKNYIISNSSSVDPILFVFWHTLRLNFFPNHVYADYATVQPVAVQGRGPGGLVPSLFLDQTEARRPEGRIFFFFFLDTGPPLISGSGWLPPPPHPTPPHPRFISRSGSATMHLYDLCVWTVSCFPIQETPLVSIITPRLWGTVGPGWSNGHKRTPMRQCPLPLSSFPSPLALLSFLKRDDWGRVRNETIAYPYSLFSFYVFWSWPLPLRLLAAVFKPRKLH